MDPRTGLGRYKNYRISNYQLMEVLIDCCRTMEPEQILLIPDVAERVRLYYEQTEHFLDMVRKHTVTEKSVIISDLPGVDPIYTGNRFMIYSLYPAQNISLWIVDGKGGNGCACSVGHSILNRTSQVDVGSLMLKYGGGGHEKVGTCQFSTADMNQKIPQLIDEIVNYHNYRS
jgi:nanoRNase/pAp phosphatase (c-di-AMP/oligoRNAs hydrolase)